jgi:hypothetical protein
LTLIINQDVCCGPDTVETELAAMTPRNIRTTKRAFIGVVAIQRLAWLSIGRRTSGSRIPYRLAASLNDRSVRLGERGRVGASLDAITEAVVVYRRLAEVDPDTARPHLAASLNNFASRLARVGRLEEALAAAKDRSTSAADSRKATTTRRHSISPCR